MSEEATLDEFTKTTASQKRQETPIGELPKDWGVEWLKDVVKINPDGFSEEDWASETFEYISLSEVSDGEVEGSTTTRLEDAPSRAQRTILQGDVLVGTVRPKQRSHGFVSEEHAGKICSSGFGVLRTETRLNSLYLLQEILSNRFFSQMEAYVAGSGYPAVKISDLKKHRVALPPLPEQRKIATVLYTVDRAIEKAEEIREQINRSKKAVAQDLIHTGIGEQETKDTWMGKIPTHWSVRDFSEIIKLSRNGIYKDEDSYGGPHPIIKMGDIFGGVVLEEPITESVYLDDGELNKYEAIEGDLVFARHAQAGWGAGDCTYVPDMDEKPVVESNMVQIRLTNEMEPLFYAQYFNSEIGVKSIKRITTTGNIKSISQGDLMNLKVPVPPKQEQMKIAETLSSFDDQAHHSESEVERLSCLKRGLMQDLLSGTVRTTDTNIEVPEEIEQYG